MNRVLSGFAGCGAVLLVALVVLPGLQQVGWFEPQIQVGSAVTAAEAASSPALDALSKELAAVKQGYAQLRAQTMRRPSPAVDETASAAEAGSVAGLLEKIDSLTAEVALLNERLDVDSDGLDTADNLLLEGLSRAEQTEILEAEDAAKREAFEQAWREEIDHAQADFELQAIDEEWSTAASTLVETALNNERLGASRLAGLECRETVCRIEATHDDFAGMQIFLDVLASRVGAVLPSMTVDQVNRADGSFDTVLYLASGG